MHSLKAIDFENLTPTQLAVIVDILDEFDFDKVEAYMNDINWEWNAYDEEGNETRRVPNQTTLRAALRKLLVNAFNSMNEWKKEGKEVTSPMFSSCGGFSVYVWPNDVCQVYFAVTDWWADEDWVKTLKGE